MAKQIYKNKEARERLLTGAEIVVNALIPSYGPEGQDAVIGQGFGVKITNDGATIAESIEVPETKETMGYAIGAEIIKQACRKLNKTSGDGTTSVAILTYFIMKESHKLIEAGYKSKDIKRGLIKAGEEVIAFLDKEKQDVSDKIQDVATIAARDPETGKLVADVIKKVGKEGFISVEESETGETYSEIVEGYQFDRGYVSPFFVNTDKQTVEYDNPYIFLTDKKLSTAEDFDLALGEGFPLVVICEDIEDAALKQANMYKLQGYKLAVVKSPGLGERKDDLLADMSLLLGASIDSDTNAKPASPGTADKVVITKEKTTIIGGKGDIKPRIKQIRIELEQSIGLKKDQLNQRLAQLQGKVGVIHVGGQTDEEIMELKDRIDDAVGATKGALEEGILPGGGATLLRASDKLKDDDMGYKVLKEALKQPFNILMENSGISSDVSVYRIKFAPMDSPVVNVRDGEFVPAFNAGIIDPASVVKEVVRTAVSLGASFANTGRLVVEIPEE